MCSGFARRVLGDVVGAVLVMPCLVESRCDGASLFLRYLHCSCVNNALGQGQRTCFGGLSPYSPLMLSIDFRLLQ